MTKEIIEAVTHGIQYILIISELTEIVREKEKAVRQQNFELASSLRTKEVEIEKLLPTTDILSSIRDRLNKSIETNE